MNKEEMREIDERTSLASNSMFELLMFRLGETQGTSKREIFGINVFKVREILVMPEITAMVNAPQHVMGIANVRGQMIPVIDLASVTGCKPSKGLGILLVTEFLRTTQAFAVEEVDEIVRLGWKHVLSAEANGSPLVTSIARLDGDAEDTRLAQVLDVEQILRNVFPGQHRDVLPEDISTHVELPPGTVIMAADDSAVARMMIEQGLKTMNLPFIMTKSGKEAWDRLRDIADKAEAQGQRAQDKIALILSDLEMPEMDGFTLTRHVKADKRFANIPVIIHSSLTGTTNEAHVKTVGADAYVPKFVPEELAATIRTVLKKRR